MKLFLPLSWLYASVLFMRNKLFDWGVLKSEAVGVPVISVGNLTVGGTGKTPLVEYIVRQLLDEGKRVAVVSRGYKRSSRGVVVVSDGMNLFAQAEQGGDEPVQIAQKFPRAIVVVGEKRVEAARRAVQLGAGVVVMDDGFQHRYLKRDLDIVVIDATKDITRESVLPAGRLRESLSGLQRAHVVAFSKFDDTDLLQHSLAEKLGAYFSGSFIRYRYILQEVRRAHDNGLASTDVVKRMRLLAFSGIGNHEAFTDELRTNGFAPMSDMRFSDHHRYSEGDVLTLASFAKAMNADACITTEKDVVRLRSDNNLSKMLFGEIPVFYLKIEVEMLGGRETLHTRITSCFRGKAIS